MVPATRLAHTHRAHGDDSLAYDQTQMQEVIKKIDELINALRR